MAKQMNKQDWNDYTSYMNSLVQIEKKKKTTSNKEEVIKTFNVENLTKDAKNSAYRAANIKN